MNTFRELEYQGWVDRASVYRDMFGRITSQAIEPILAALGNLSGRRFLDVACGTGELAAAAAARGARAEGIDFAATMVDKAARAHASARFREGDAERLPYAAESFDIVTCSFGILHLEHPEKAVAEARRVLSRGGIYAFTAWCSPDQGGEFFDLVLSAVQKFGTPNAPLPPAPPFFRFSNPDECRRVVEAAGFTNPKFTVLDFRWRAQRPDEVLELIYKSVVRAPMILAAQAPEARERIHRSILEGAERYRRGSELDIAFPAILITAVAA